MLYREDEKFKLMPFKATYTQHEEEHVTHIVNKKEVQAYEEMGHISDLVIEDAVYGDDVVERLAEVADYPEKEYQAVSEYVMDGKIQKGSMIDTSKQRETLELSVIELSEMMTGVMF